MLGQPTRAQLAALVDHTLLKPETTRADVAALVAEAAELGVYAVCGRRRWCQLRSKPVVCGLRR